MGERVSRLFQRTTVPEDTASTDSDDYTTASDEDTVSGSNDESCADSVDSGGTDYTTADEDIASDSSPGTSEGNALLAAEHSATVSPEITTTIPTPSHQPYSSLSSSQAQETQPPLSQPLQASSLLSSQVQEAQPHSHQPQASALSVSQVQPPGSHLPSIPSSQAQGSLRQPQPSIQLSSEQCFASTGTPVNSPESKALSQQSAEVFKAISASDQLDLAWLLFAKDLIGQEIVAYCQLEVTQFKKSSQIVCAVIETVTASPHLFESLVSVFSESGNTALMSVGEKLKQTYESMKERLADSPPSPRAQEAQLPLSYSTPPSHDHQLPPPPSQPQSPELCLYANYLKAVYTRSKLPIYSKWPPSPGMRFINLAIISKEGITKEEADEFTKATLHGDLEEILKKKAPVKLEEILQAKPDEDLKCVLIEGAPGVGKTTLSWEVCHRWGKGELYQEYSTVVLLRLRDQNVQIAKRVADLFYYPDEDTQKQIAKDIVKSQGNDILIILEGLDELPNNLISESSIFARILSGTELPHATILVTSRPSATYKLWENWRQHISRHIEILGFTDGNIIEYTQSVLPVNEQVKFQDYLSLHPYIRSMLYIPLHCAITTIIYLQCQQSDKPPPKTLTELYTCLTQAILVRYLNNHPEYRGKNITLDTLSNLPPPVYDHFLSLSKFAFDGVNEQKQVFHSPPDPFEHLGFMDAVSELFIHQQSASYSYNFLHLSVQEYLAAYHVSLMSHQEQEQLLQAVDYYDHRSNMIRFLAGMTNFKDLDKAVVKKVTGIEHMLSMYTLELLYECQDVSILDSEGKIIYEIYISTDSLHQLHSLGYCIANSKSKWNLIFKYKNNIGVDILCQSLKKALHPGFTIESINFGSCNSEFTFKFLELILPILPRLPTIQIQSDSVNMEISFPMDSLGTFTGTPKLISMILPQQSQELIAHIGSLTVTSSCLLDDPQPLPPCLPELIPRMERLNTLTLENVLDTSLTELMPALYRVPTLRNLRIQSDSGKLEMLFSTDNLLPTGTINASCTPKLIGMFLPQLPQQTIAHIGSLTVTCSYSQEDPQPLPSSLPELIPRMERLETLTLKNVLDTSLTELIPALSKVPTLRNLRIQSESGKLEMLFPTDSLLPTGTINASCTPKLIGMFLSQLPHQTIVHIESLTATCFKSLEDPQPLPPCLPELISRMERLETLTLHESMKDYRTHKMTITFSNNSIETIECQDCTTDFINKILPLLSHQSATYVIICNDIGHYQPLPPCLPELIPRMERLDTLTLKNILDTSLTELIPALSRFPTLRNLRVQSDTGNLQLLHNMDSLLSTISGTPKLIGMFLLQQPQQTIVHIGSLTVTSSCSQEDPQPLPPCLPELIPRMETLNTLTLENVLYTSMTELIPVLSKVPALRHLTLHKLNSKGFAPLCLWLPTCQLETLTLHEQTEALATHKIAVNFCNNSIEAIECQYCTAEFIDQILSLLPQQLVTHIQAFTIWNETHHNQPLPPSLPGIIPTLNTLTLMNVLDTSLAVMLPALSRVPTLRNLRIQSDSGKLEMLFPTDSLLPTGTINASCTPKLIGIYLSQLPQQTIACIGSLTVTCSYSQEDPQPLPPCLSELIPKMEKLETLTLRETMKDYGTHKMTITFSNNSIEAIECQDCTTDFINQILPLLSHQSATHVIICNDIGHYQPLPPCLPELIPRMERLDTLTLKNVLDTSLTELIPVLSRVPTLRKLRIQSDTGNLQILPVMERLFSTISGTPKLIGMFLPQLPQQIIAHIGSLTVTKSYSQDDPQPLPPCLPELIPRMETLNTLTLENVPDTSMTELIPVLSKVPALRNLTLHKLNSKGFTLLCLWLPTCQLETLTLHEQTEALATHKIAVNFCNNSIKAIECQYCTAEFIDQILPLLSHQSATHVIICNDIGHYQPLPSCLPELIPRMERLNTLTLKNVLDTSLTELIPALSRVPALRNLRIHSDTGNLQIVHDMDSLLSTISGTPKLIGMFLPQLPQQTIAHIRSLTVTSSYSQEGPQPLPPCLPELIPRMEKLKTLTLKNVLDTSLTELIPALSRVPTLRNFKLNSEGIIALLCQWLPTCQLETLTLCIRQHTEVIVTPRITINFSNNSIEAIECYHCSTEFIDQFLSQIPQQSTIHIKTLKICNDQPQQLPALIPEMEQLNTLHCLHKLNSEGIALLCQWLPTCQLETLTLHSLSPDHSVMLCKALTSVSSLKTLDIRESKYTFQSMQAFVSMLQQNQSLTELVLTYCTIDSDSAHYLAEALHHNTTLKRLVMLGNPVGERVALTMAEMLKHNTTLEELNFIGTNISSDGACCLVEALHHNTTLRKFDMRGNSVGERGALAMAEMLKHNTTLEELYLSHTKISSDCAVTIVEALHHNSRLRKLNMSGNPVGERGALAMAEMFNYNTTLEELDLFLAQITGDGAVAMAEALHHNTTLRKLNISGNSIQDRAALAMAEMLKHNITLEELDLRIFIQYNGIKALAKSLVENKNLKKLIISSRYRDCVESLPVYHHVKGRVELH